ncbi:MAG TPA: hypothetical protein GXZ59_03555 [Clostridiaceae bacterium]|nr:hypothetical protein [Clostridiaceae bacterium]
MSREKDKLDDGRVIANMDVEGMPWTRPSLFDTAAGRFARKDFREMKEKRLAREEQGLASPVREYSQKDIRTFTRNSILSALLVAGVYIAGFVLFILFCVYVWLR